MTKSQVYLKHDNSNTKQQLTAEKIFVFISNVWDAHFAIFWFSNYKILVPGNIWATVYTLKNLHAQSNRYTWRYKH